MLGFRRDRQQKPTHDASARNDAPDNAPRHVGELLLQNGLITQEQLDKALAEQSNSNAYLGQILVKQKAINQDDLTSNLVKYCKIPHLSLQGYDINQEVLGLISQETCLKYHLLPIDKLGRILTVAMVDPLNTAALDEVKQSCPDLRIKPILCHWQHFEQVCEKAFGKKEGRTVTMQSFGFAPGANQKAAKDSPASSEAPTAPPKDTIPPKTPAPSETKQQEYTAISQKAITESIRESMQEALKETTAVLSTHLNALRASQSAASATSAPDMTELAQVFRGSVREAMQEVMASVAQSAPAPVETPKSPVIDTAPTEQLASIMRETLGDAMKEAFSTLSTEIRSHRETAQLQPVDSPDLQESHRMLVSALRSGMQEVVEATRTAHSEQESRLTALAEATLQSVQQTSHLLESTVVQQQGNSDLQRASHKDHSSVAPFKHFAAATDTSNAAEIDAEKQLQANSDSQVRNALDSEHPQETLTFETFIPGKANEFTYRLSKAVSQRPGEEYNPYFLFGHVGIGKTHLISAMGNAIMQLQPHLRVGYVSASHFSKRLADALKDQAIDAFRAGYCCWEVLILDDIQFLGGRIEAQEEFFHIFNVLHQQGRQIIIASDKAPDRLGLLEQRLVSRFASGIVAELKAPEWETRMAILRMCATSAGVSIPEEILSLIAMRVPNDIRKMTGSLRKVIAYADLVGQELNCDLANDILSHLGAIDAA